MGKSRSNNQSPLEAERLLLRHRLDGPIAELVSILKEGIGKEVLEDYDLLHTAQIIMTEVGYYLIEKWINNAIESGELQSIKGKQKLAKTINSMCRKCGMYIEHPESHDDCFLLAINDKWGGKFVLENKDTKKRSCTTADIKTLLPLHYRVYIWDFEE